MRPLLILLVLVPLYAEESYLDNGVIRIGVDLDLGGSITHLSASGGPNMINSHDYGRQIQQSYYSGPQPFGTAHPSWANWPWNPIGTGDVDKNKARVLAYSNDGESLWVRTLPMQWALNNVSCDCTFDTWITVEGNVAKVRARLNSYRTDRTQYRAFDQELPAIYSTGVFHRLITYDGAEPFTGAPTTLIPPRFQPWANWQATENWAALVNDEGTGFGVFHPGVYRFIGGFAGRPGSGGPKDGPTGYISPLHREILDGNMEYAYAYTLIAGTVETIRGYVYANRPEARPRWIFERDRQHWTYTNASDPGWPIREHLRVDVASNDPQMTGPPAFWKAADVPQLYIRGAWRTQASSAQIFWSVPGGGFAGSRSVTFPVIADGEVRTYAVDIPWEGVITGLRFDPVAQGKPGEYVDVYWISWRDELATAQ